MHAGFLGPGLMMRKFKTPCTSERYCPTPPPPPDIFVRLEEIQRKTFTQGTIGTWVRCNRDSLDFNILIRDVRPYHANLSTKDYKSLIYRSVHIYYYILFIANC